MRAEKKKRYISYKVDSYLKDRFLYKPNRLADGLGCCSSGAGARWYEKATRCINMSKFMCMCSLSLIQVLTPWALCVAEVVSVILIWALCCLPAAAHAQQDTNTPPGPTTAPHGYHFSYYHSLEDVVGLSCTRSMLLSAAYALGMQQMHRPYLYASYLLAACCFPYLVVKMILFRYGPQAVPAAAIFIITSLFCWLHVFAARRSVEWARRRYQLGLGGAYPWEEDFVPWAESGWGLLRRCDVEDGAAGAENSGKVHHEDIPAEEMADDDSKFLQIAGIKVHYKEVVPSSLPGGAEGDASQTGIVLVHGFGAGVFAWRHILEPLAIQCQCRVVAFDRPAFGLTSRPLVSSAQSNPYALGSQAHLLLSLCQALGLTKVVLAGHADGCLLVLRAASMALRSHQLPVSWDSSGQTGSPCSSSQTDTPRTSRGGAAPGSDNQQCSSQAASYHPPGIPLSMPSDAPVPQKGFISAHQLTAPAPGGASSSTGAAGPGTGDVLLDVAMAGFSDNGVGAQPTSSQPDSATTLGSTKSRQRTRSSADTVVAAALLCEEGAGPPPADLSSTVGSAFGRPGAAPRGLQAPPMPVLNESGKLLSMDSWPVPVAGTAPAGVDGVSHRASVPAVVVDPAGGSGTEPGGNTGLNSVGSVSNSQGQTGAVKKSLLDFIRPQRSEGTRHRRVQSTPGPVVEGRSSSSQVPANIATHPTLHGSQRSNSGELVAAPETPTAAPQGGPWPQVLGLALLHPNLSGSQGPALSRLLASSRLGRSILRPLLRSELGEVANRRAWHNTNKLTAEVLDLYKAPLRVEGWCESLIETTRLRRDQWQGDLATYLSDARPLPCLLLTGEYDRVVPPARVEGLCGELPHSCTGIVPGCGHLSHEEAPGPLLEHLAPFCGQLLNIPPIRIQADR